MRRAPCGQAERAEGGTSGTLVTEILGAPQRETVKEELVKCVLASRRPPHHPPRDGSIDLAEDPSVPEGQAKSEQAPIRRPPSRGGPLHRSAPSALFFWTVHGPFSFRARPKRKRGVHPAGPAPLREQNPPGRRRGGLSASPWRMHLPGHHHGCIHRRGIAIPVPWRGRQSRRFLETASLHPPLAALRRFPPSNGTSPEKGSRGTSPLFPKPAYSFPCSRSASTVSGRPHRLIKPVALVWS